MARTADDVTDRTSSLPGRRLALSLRSRLIVLVTLSVVPLLLFSLANEYLTYREHRAGAVRAPARAPRDREPAAGLRDRAPFDLKSLSERCTGSARGPGGRTREASGWQHRLWSVAQSAPRHLCRGHPAAADPGRLGRIAVRPARHNRRSCPKRGALCRA